MAVTLTKIIDDKPARPDSFTNAHIACSPHDFPMRLSQKFPKVYPWLFGE